jgi:Cu/Ag efflux pump CusA
MCGREKIMITAPLYVATIIAFLTALSLALVFIPSVMTTILRYVELISGVLPSS